jgi:RsiW-degrading membrane proteinase PrsW (M82 family)
MAYLAVVSVVTSLVSLLWIRWLMAKDAYAVQKGNRHLVLVFFLGGLASGPLCLVFYGLNFFEIFSDSHVIILYLYHFLVVGLSEEGAKLLVFILLARALGSVKDPMDAAIQGAAVGIGFAIIENVLYGLGRGMEVLLYRSFITVPGHMAYTSLAAFGLGAAFWWPQGSEERTWLPPGCFAAAVVLHGSYNTLLDYGLAGPALLLDLAVFVGIIVLIEKARQASPYRGFRKQDWQQAVGNLSQGIRHQPRNPGFYLRRGYYWLCGRQHRRAAADFAKASALSGGDPFYRAWEAAAELLDNGPALAEAVLEDMLRRLTPKRRQFFRQAAGQALHGSDWRRITLIVDRTILATEGEFWLLARSRERGRMAARARVVRSPVA